MPFIPFKKGSNSHAPGTFDSKSKESKGSPKPTPAGPGGKFDPDDSPGKDENGDGIFGKPVKSAKNVKVGKAALNGLKAAKPGQAG